MLQLSGEIEEAAIIQDIPWIKRMTPDHHPDPEILDHHRIHASVHDVPA